MNRSKNWENNEPTEEDLLRKKAPLAVEENGGLDPLQNESKGKVCHKYFKEYTSSTSLHGLQYLGEDGRPIIERVWWVIMFSLSMAACVYLIMQVWIKWQTIPVIVTLSETPTPIWKISHPAVTVCSETKTLATIFNYTDVTLRRPDIKDWESEYYEAISLVCKTEVVELDHLSNRSIIEMMKDVAPTLNDLFFACMWKNAPIDCDKIFSQTITEDGVCYTFNMLDAEEMYKKESFPKDYHFVNHGNLSTGWNLHDGYPKNDPIDTYPFRGSGSGSRHSLVLVLKSHSEDLDYACSGLSQGFKVALHTPGDVPRLSQNYVVVPLSQYVIIGMKPNMLTASDVLIDYDPKKRNCFFPYERQLRYFKHYSRDNCLSECISNYTVHVCGCAQFFMPRASETPICGPGNHECVNHIEDELLMRDIRKGLQLKRMKNGEETVEERLARLEKNKVAKMCQCLPGCTSIAYDVETSINTINLLEYLRATSHTDVESAKNNYTSYEDQKTSFLEKNNLTLLQNDLGTHTNKTRKNKNIQLSAAVIFFKEPEFIMSVRSELYGRTDFLANCGGLLGLCCGFSVLSLIEIIYFLTLRACSNYKRLVSRNSNDIRMNEM